MEEAGRGQTAIVRECQEVLLTARSKSAFKLQRDMQKDHYSVIECVNYAISIKRNILMGTSKLHFTISGRKVIVGVK